MMLGSRKPNAYQPLLPAMPPAREDPDLRWDTVTGAGKATVVLESLATTPLRALSPANEPHAPRCANRGIGSYHTARGGEGHGDALVCGT